MALIRGLRGLRACPKCLVPSNALSDLSTSHEPRTTAKTVEILEAVNTKTAEERENILKENGMRWIPVSINCNCLSSKHKLT